MLRISPHNQSFLRDLRNREYESICKKNMKAFQGAWNRYLDLAFVKVAAPHTLFKLNKKKLNLHKQFNNLQGEKKELHKKRDSIKQHIRRVGATFNYEFLLNN